MRNAVSRTSLTRPISLSVSMASTKVLIACTNCMSPSTIAAAGPRAAWIEGSPRRSGASSITSSWIRVATCSISSETAAMIAFSGSRAAPAWSRADKSNMIGRTRLPRS